MRTRPERLASDVPARRLNPFRHALEPALAATAVAVVALTSFVPLLVLSGVVAIVLGARIYYNHAGLGERWNELHGAITPVVVPGRAARAHMLVSGILVGILGACLLGAGASAAAAAAGVA